MPTSTKGGKVKPTQKGVAMSLKQCERLFRVKRKLFELYHEQASSLAGKVVINPTAPSKQVRCAPFSNLFFSLNILTACLFTYSLCI